MEQLNDDTLLEEYMGDTEDDIGAITFINSDKCTLAMVNYDEYDGWTPLILAARLNRTQVVKALIDKGADVNYINHDYSYTALMHCISEGTPVSPEEKKEQYETIKLLIDSGTNLNYAERFSAFSMACELSMNNIIELLLQHPIDIYFVDEDDKSGLDYLRANNNEVGLNLVNRYVLNNKLQEELPYNKTDKEKKKI